MIRRVAVRTLLLHVLLAGCVAGSTLRGRLADVAVAYLRDSRDYRCEAMYSHLVFGQLWGCLRKVADTTAYFYRDRQGNVVATGRVVEGDSSILAGEFEALLRSLSVFGTQTMRTCDQLDPPWRLRDVRVSSEGFQRRVQLATATRYFGARSYVIQSEELGVTDCSAHLSVPYRR